MNNSLQRTKSRVLDWQDPFLIHERERRRIIFIIGGIFQKSLVYRGMLSSNQNRNKLFYWQMWIILSKLWNLNKTACSCFIIDIEQIEKYFINIQSS